MDPMFPGGFVLAADGRLRHVFTVSIALLVCGFVCAARPQEAGNPAATDRNWRASGRVVNALTGAPVSKASVTLTPTGGDAPSVSTNIEGEFEFTGDTPGYFHLTAERSGYLKGAYGSRRPRTTGIPVRIEPSQRLSGLEIRLSPPASISGRAYNEEGDPIARVSVQIFSQQYRRGRRQWIPAVIEQTNERGEYRAYGLAPGKYIIAAQVFADRRDGAAVSLKPGEPEMAYGLLVFPNGDDLAQAQVIELSAGAELSNIDLVLRKTRVFSARGRVESFINSGATAAHLVVARQGTAGRSSFPLKPDGSFELRNLEPATYSLMARLESGAAPLIAQATLIVADRDIEGLVLHPTAGYTLTGRMNFSSDQPREQPQASVSLVSQDGSLIPSPSARVRPDGTFNIAGVAPGPYRLEAFVSDQSAYLKAAKLSGADILDRQFDITGPATLAITAGFDASAISGIARLNDKPAPGATVVLLPTGARRAIPAYYKAVLAGTDGHFQFEGVVPGEFILLAFGDVESGEWYDPEFIKQYESKALKLTATAAGRHNASLDVIERR